MTRSLEDIRQSLMRNSRERWGAVRTEALSPVLEQTAREVHAVELYPLPHDEEPLYYPSSSDAREEEDVA